MIFSLFFKDRIAYFSTLVMLSRYFTLVIAEATRDLISSFSVLAIPCFYSILVSMLATN